MLCCTTLYCTILYYTILYDSILPCAVLYCTLLHCTALHSTALHSTELHCTVLHCTVLYYTQLYSTSTVCTWTIMYFTSMLLHQLSFSCRLIKLICLHLDIWPLHILFFLSRYRHCEWNKYPIGYATNQPKNTDKINSYPSDLNLNYCLLCLNR